MLGEKILLEADFYVGQALRVLLGVTEADEVVILVRSGILAFNVRLGSLDQTAISQVPTLFALVIFTEEITA
jgi:hypothetical protein